MQTAGFIWRCNQAVILVANLTSGELMSTLLSSHVCICAFLLLNQSCAGTVSRWRGYRMSLKWGIFVVVYGMLNYTGVIVVCISLYLMLFIYSCSYF